MATIGSIAVNIVANSQKFTAGLNKARTSLAEFSKKASLLGAGITASFAASIKSFAAVGSELHDMSRATGVAVEQLSFFKYAAEQSGTSLDAFAKAAREMQKNGVDPARFQQIAASIAAIKNPTDRAKAAFEAFGTRAGAALLPLLGDLPALNKRFHELGGPITTEMAKSADKLGDSFGDIKQAVMNVSVAVADVLAPAVSEVATFIADNIKTMRDWIKGHETAVVALAATAAALTVIAPALYAINTAVVTLRGSILALNAASALAMANPLIAALVGLAVAGGAIIHAASGEGGLAGPTPGASGSWDAPAGNGKAVARNTDKTATAAQRQVKLQEKIASGIDKMNRNGGGSNVTLVLNGIR